MTKNNQPSKPEIKPGEPLKPPVNTPAPAETPKAQDTPESPATKEAESSELEALKAELAAKEAELAEREKALQKEGEALQEMQKNLDASAKDRPRSDYGVGLMESDIDLKDAPEEVKRGAHPNATALDRKAYSKHLRQHYKGKTPLADFEVEVKKAREVVKVERVKAVDGADAIRRVLMRAGMTSQSGDYNFTATKVVA